MSPARAIRGAVVVALATSCGAAPSQPARAEPSPSAATGPRRLELDVPLTDRIGDEDVTVMRFVDGPVYSVPPDQPFVVPGRTYVALGFPAGDYALELRAVDPEAPVHPSCSGFEVRGDPGPWGGCPNTHAFTVSSDTPDGILRFTVTERGSPTGRTDVPRSLCGDYTLVLRAGVPPCLRGGSGEPE